MTRAVRVLVAMLMALTSSVLALYIAVGFSYDTTPVATSQPTAKHAGTAVHQGERARAPDSLVSLRLYDDRSQLARTSARLDGYRLAPNTARNFGNYGGEFLDDAIRSPVVRPDLGNLSSKIQRQMGARGWTPDLIDEAVQQGRAFPAVNKLGGANTPATRYVHPGTGQSVVIDNATGQVIQVGGPGFRY